MAKFKFTKEMLINEMVEALQEEPTQGTTAEPNAIKKLLSKARLNKGGNERTTD